MGKKIICVDFDGVLHSYDSGWKGPAEIPDPPVPGALEWLNALVLDGRFDVQIYSSRSRYPNAIVAMCGWLRKHAELQGFSNYECEVLLGSLSFPTEKPAATLSIDDRGFCFRGRFPTPNEIDSFKPWNKGGQTAEGDAILVGWYTIERLLKGDQVIVRNIALMPASDLAPVITGPDVLEQIVTNAISEILQNNVSKDALKKPGKMTFKDIVVNVQLCERLEAALEALKARYDYKSCNFHYRRNDPIKES